MEHIEARSLVCTKTAPLCAVIATVFAVGCVPKTDGLTDIFDDGHSYVEFPGKRVLSGRLTSFAVDHDDSSGPVALGLRDGRLVMSPFEGGHECDAGVAADFALSGLYEFNTPEKTPKVPFLESLDEQWRGPLRFTDHSCNVSALEPVLAADLPLFERGRTLLPDGYLVLADTAPAPLDSFRRLIECLPWDPEICFELALVRQIAMGRSDTWSLELDPQATEIIGEPTMRLVKRWGSTWAEIGLEVSEFALESARGDAAFVNPDGLSLVEDSGAGIPEPIEADACQLWAARGLLYSNVFSYRAPCESGKLVVYDAKTRERFGLAGNADPPAIVSYGDSNHDRVAFYQTDVAELPPAEETNRFARYAFETKMPYVTGKLWAERLDSATPVAGPERALLASVVWLGTRAQVVADYDGSTGRLVSWDVDSGEITELASGVVDFGYDMVLSDFDGTAGTLRRILPDRSTAVLAQGVPDRGSQPLLNSSCFVGACFDSDFVTGTVRWAVLSDYDGTTGTLLLFSRDLNSFGFGAPEVIEHGVPLRGYRLLNEGDALLFLKNYDANLDTGELNARFLSTLDTFAVPGVDRFVEVSYPDAGLLYSVPEGERAGVWYARLR